MASNLEIEYKEENLNNISSQGYLNTKNEKIQGKEIGNNDNRNENRKEEPTELILNLVIELENNKESIITIHNNYDP